MERNGSILFPEQYALAKLIDHSGWKGLLPRGITPSDVDAVLDTGKRILLIDFSVKYSEWKDLSYGQRTMYENIVAHGGGKITAVLARHKRPEPGIPMNSLTDIEEFQWMRVVRGFIVYSQVRGAKYWVPFIKHYFTIGC